MSLLRDALKDEDQLSNDVVVSMIEKPAGMAGESVVATVRVRCSTCMWSISSIVVFSR